MAEVVVSTTSTRAPGLPLLPFLQLQLDASTLSPGASRAALAFSCQTFTGVQLHYALPDGSLWPVGLDGSHPMGVLAFGWTADGTRLITLAQHPQAGPRSAAWSARARFSHSLCSCCRAWQCGCSTR